MFVHAMLTKPHPFFASWWLSKLLNSPVHSLATYSFAGAVNFQCSYFTLAIFVEQVWKVLSATVRTNLLLLFSEPLLEAGVAEVLSTATREVGVSKWLGANHTLKFVWHFFNKLTLITTLNWGRG